LTSRDRSVALRTSSGSRRSSERAAAVGCAEQTSVVQPQIDAAVAQVDQALTELEADPGWQELMGIMDETNLTRFVAGARRSSLTGDGWCRGCHTARLAA
jgi:hypothetical protein